MKQMSGRCWVMAACGADCGQAPGEPLTRRTGRREKCRARTEEELKRLLQWAVATWPPRPAARDRPDRRIKRWGGPLFGAWSIATPGNIAAETSGAQARPPPGPATNTHAIEP